jgi:hypothetical protein
MAKHMRILPIIFISLLMCGCQTRSDAGRLIISQVAQYGSHTRTTAAIPRLNGSWNVKLADTMSFRAHLTGVTLADFNSFMQEVYGKPASTSVTVGHEWAKPGHVYYWATDIGVYIEYYRQWIGISFYCHRGIHVTPLGTTPPPNL